MIHRKVFAARFRHRTPVRRVLLAVAAGVALWLLGLAWFATILPTAVSEPERATDAIVVLTGGRGRVHQGLKLLAERRAKKLFVSGVYRGVDVKELLRISRQSPQDLVCCIALGYEADSTRGNAVETAAWMRAQGLRSLRLVTAAYHMPRSLIEFKRLMPDIQIVPHPVFPEDFTRRRWWPWPGGAILIAKEYSKYLIALLRDRLVPRPAR